MSNHIAVRRIQFCSGHRVHLHESKCKNIHGHNYVAFIHARGIVSPLDNIGRVIDFSVLKDKIGGWIDRCWDHGFIYYTEDAEMLGMFKNKYASVLNSHKSFGLPYNPTAENMAKFLCEEVCPYELEGLGIEVFKVTLWETENCYAEYRLPKAPDALTAIRT
jgi:6-pyruvoyltetrahydropterin/6-carboxytetrahydropterin synthase